MIGTFKSRDGVRISYHMWNGSKHQNWIIFIHGLGGNLTAWDPILRNLTHKNQNILALDLRGHGHSGRPKRKKFYGFYHNAEDLIDLMDHLNIKKASLFGHSSGASIAMDAAIRFPERIERIGLLGPNHGRMTRNLWVPEFMVYWPLRLISTLLVILGKLLANRKLKYPSYAKLKSTSGLYTFYQDMMGNDLRVYYYNMWAFMESDLSARISEIRCPVLIVYGKSDPFVNKKSILELSEKTEALTIELQDAKHQLIHDNNQELAWIIDSYMEGNL